MTPAPAIATRPHPPDLLGAHHYIARVLRSAAPCAISGKRQRQPIQLAQRQPQAVSVSPLAWERRVPPGGRYEIDRPPDAPRLPFTWRASRGRKHWRRALLKQTRISHDELDQYARLVLDGDHGRVHRTEVSDHDSSRSSRSAGKYTWVTDVEWHHPAGHTVPARRADALDLIVHACGVEVLGVTHPARVPGVVFGPGDVPTPGMVSNLGNKLVFDIDDKDGRGDTWSRAQAIADVLLRRGCRPVFQPTEHGCHCWVWTSRALSVADREALAQRILAEAGVPDDRVDIRPCSSGHGLRHPCTPGQPLVTVGDDGSLVVAPGAHAATANNDVTAEAARMIRRFCALAASAVLEVSSPVWSSGPAPQVSRTIDDFSSPGCVPHNLCVETREHSPIPESDTSEWAESVAWEWLALHAIYEGRAAPVTTPVQEGASPPSRATARLHLDAYLVRSLSIDRSVELACMVYGPRYESLFRTQLARLAGAPGLIRRCQLVPLGLPDVEDGDRTSDPELAVLEKSMNFDAWLSGQARRDVELSNAAVRRVCGSRRLSRGGRRVRTHSDAIARLRGRGHLVFRRDYSAGLCGRVFERRTMCSATRAWVSVRIGHPPGRSRDATPCARRFCERVRRSSGQLAPADLDVPAQQRMVSSFNHPEAMIVGWSSG